MAYGLMCLLSLLLLGYLRVNRHAAFKGDPSASRKVILPAFEPLLWILAATTGIYVVFFSVAIEAELYTNDFPNIDREVFYAGRQFVFVLVLVFFCQKSVSLSALRCAVAQSVLLVSYTVPMIWILTRFAPQDKTMLFVVRITARPLLLVFVAYVCVLHPPAGRANSRVLRTHGGFILGYHVQLIAYSFVKKFAQDSIAYGVLTLVIVIWSSFCPLLIWRLLRADTEYWRGMGEHVCSLQRVAQPSASHSGSDLLGAVDECISSHGIHLLIEMHRKFLIDFAHLELRRKMGVGKSASVFGGLLRSRTPVAVKVYTPSHFTQETVAEFSHEAALCATLCHPNIVKFYGMCVCPPTICLVSELCQCSLEDLLHTQAESRSRQRVTPHLVDVGGDVNNGSDLERQQMALNVAYMLDCARAVAYVHSFTPPFLHRDIKPANFLVDNDNNVKLTDFGDSRRLPREHPVATNSSKSNDPNNGWDRPTTSTGTLSSTSRDASIAIVNPPAPPKIKMTVTGTISYMAPEMIGGRTGLASYGEAADVYSLAITFWDVLHPGREKYPTANSNHMLVFEGVLGGSRPPLDDPALIVPPGLLELITSAWHDDPNQRPTAHHIVRVLERIQEEALAGLALRLNEDFDRSGSASTMAPGDACFTGEYAVERMEEMQATGSLGEGVRLGRALMDAGFLHHLEHDRGFEATTTMYFFDNGNISFCQPLAMLEASSSESQETDYQPRGQKKQGLQMSATTPRKVPKRSRLLSHLTSSFATTCADADTRCDCRKFGRRPNGTEAKTSERQPNRQIRSNWRGNVLRQQARSQRLQSSCGNLSRSNGSNEEDGPSSGRQRRKGEQQDTLTHKLLEEAQSYTIDIGDDEALRSI
ncbi:hypothetical protein BBJ28_00000656 [Nothophytophthora sp. Chile5]|nr:hypothetical protein BBJ28_00000656 [Nothophytophthora sp. Chile5]